MHHNVLYRKATNPTFTKKKLKDFKVFFECIFIFKLDFIMYLPPSTQPTAAYTAAAKSQQLTHKITSNQSQPGSFHFHHIPTSSTSCRLLSVLSEHACLSYVAWSHILYILQAQVGPLAAFAGHPDSLACFGKFSARYCLQ